MKLYYTEKYLLYFFLCEMIVIKTVCMGVIIVKTYFEVMNNRYKMTVQIIFPTQYQKKLRKLCQEQVDERRKIALSFVREKSPLCLLVGDTS